MRKINNGVYKLNPKTVKFLKRMGKINSTEDAGIWDFLLVFFVGFMLMENICNIIFIICFCLGFCSSLLVSRRNRRSISLTSILFWPLLPILSLYPRAILTAFWPNLNSPKYCILSTAFTYSLEPYSVSSNSFHSPDEQLHINSNSNWNSPSCNKLSSAS